jgi:hypothetical protein
MEGNTIITGSRATTPEKDFVPYNTRKMKRAIHMWIKSNCPRYRMTMEEMVNYTLEAGIEALAQKAGAGGFGLQDMGVVEIDGGVGDGGDVNG